MNCCTVGPGKFEGESALTFLAYQAMLQGGVDESIGHVDFFKGPFADFKDHAGEAGDYGYCPECIDAALADDAYGISIIEDEQGFVWLESYGTAEEFDAALAAAERAEQDWEE
jgi:hypothetical protein